MMEWIRKHDMITKGLSLFVAFLLWIYVIDASDPEESKTFSGVGIQILGLDTLHENGLTVLEGADTTVKLILSGKRTKLGTVDRDKLTATVDVSGITIAGEYNLSYMAKAGGVDGVTVRRDPSQITLKIDRIIKKSVPVKLAIQGAPPEGYLMDSDYVLTPDAVDVQGPEQELQNVSYAYASIDVSEMKQTSTVKLSYTLMDEEGNAVDMKNITLPNPSISATITVHKAGDVPLTLDLTPIPGVPESVVSYTIEPSNVQIKGTTEKLATINSINLGSVSLVSLLENNETEITLPLILPNGITSDNAPSAVTVKFDFSHMGDKTLTIPAAQFAAQDGFEYVTPSLDVRVVGMDQMVSALTAEDITVSFDPAGLEDGEHTVAAIITSNAEDVAILGKYEITVTKVTQVTQ